VRLSATRLVVVAVVCLLAAISGNSQAADKVPLIGILTLTSAPSSSPLVEAFRQGLRDRGYVEGRNIAIEYRYADGRTDRLRALAAELVRLKVEVIVTESSAAALAAKHVTQTVPIVMAIAGDPVKAGVVGSLGRPGANVTGLTLMQHDISGKRLQLLKEAIPRTALVAVVWNPTDPAGAAYLQETEAAARILGVKIKAIEARAPTDLDAAFKVAIDARPDAFFTLPNGMFDSSKARILEFAVKNRLPGIFPSRVFVEAGGLMSYGPSLSANFKSAAVFVDKILKGAKPADLPIEQPAQLELVINLQTATRLALKLPPSVLARADQIIQ